MQLGTLDLGARSLKMEIRRIEVKQLSELDRVLSAAASTGTQAFALVSSTMFTSNAMQVVAAVERVRRPAIYSSDDFTRAGGLISYGPNTSAMFRQAASFVAKIIQGETPGDLPIEQPTTFDLVINMKAAKSLNVTVPQSVLVQATEVIQ